MRSTAPASSSAGVRARPQLAASRREVLFKDRGFEVAQLAAGFDAELVDEGVTTSWRTRAERRLSGSGPDASMAGPRNRSRNGNSTMSACSSPTRSRRVRLEFAVHAVLDRDDPHLRQPYGLAQPQANSSSTNSPSTGPRHGTSTSRRARLREQRLEARDVELVGGDLEAVAGTGPGDAIGEDTLRQLSETSFCSTFVTPAGGLSTPPTASASRSTGAASFACTRAPRAAAANACRGYPRRRRRRRRPPTDRGGGTPRFGRYRPSSTRFTASSSGNSSRCSRARAVCPPPVAGREGRLDARRRCRARRSVGSVVGGQRGSSIRPEPSRRILRVGAEPPLTRL